MFASVLLLYAEGKKSSISVDPTITSVEFVTGILEANPRSSHPTWGIEVSLFSIHQILLASCTLLTTPVNIGFLQKVPDWAHPITPKKKLPAPLLTTEEVLCTAFLGLVCVAGAFGICDTICILRGAE